MSVQTIVDRLRGVKKHVHKVALDPVWDAFFEEIKRAHEVSDSEALEAATRLAKKKHPVSEGWRTGGLRGFLKDVVRGDFGKNVTKGAVTSAIRSGVNQATQTVRDVKTVRKFIAQNGGVHGPSGR